MKASLGLKITQIGLSTCQGYGSEAPKTLYL